MFSWSKGKPSAYPGARSGSSTPGISRSDHLQSYLNDATLKPSTRRVSRDDTTYDTVFQTRSGHALIIRVHVPPDLASKPPAMTLVGVRATHSWLDDRMRVTGYQPLSSELAWASSAVKLGVAVNAVVQHLQLNPPTVLEITDESLQRIQASIAQPAAQQQPTSEPAHARFPSHPPPSHPESTSEPPPDYNTVLQAEEEGVETCHMPIPAVPASFPELETMSGSEMQDILDDEDTFRNFVEKMSAVTTLSDLQNSIYKGNVETAEANLRHEEEVDELYAEVLALQDTLREKVDAFQTLEARQARLCAPPDRREVIRKLTAAKKEAYQESEEIASDWVDGGDADVDTFLERFIERRTVHHIRAAKIERLNATM